MFDFVCLLSVPFYRYSLSVCLVEYTVMMHTQNKRSKYTLVVIYFFLNFFHSLCLCVQFIWLHSVYFVSVIGCEYQNGRANHIQQLRPKTDQIFEAMPVRSTNMRHTHTRSSAMMLSKEKKKTSTWENASKANTYTHSALFANAVKLTRCWVEYRLLSTHGASASACLRQTIRCHTIPTL